MSYLVLARKWRPQSFADMTGQEHVVRTLSNALAAGRVAHAFLFTGPRGVGKTTAARILARALNCDNGVGPEPCGKCRACAEITGGTDVDVIEIDGASNNSVDDVRSLREGAKYVPAKGRHKIYIIDEVHQLSGAAFNALLKTLEEPPAHVKFIFATTEVQKIPETILSRCQRHNFRLVPLAKMVARLQHILAAEKVTMAERAVALVARQAQGSMRDALSLLDAVLGACGDTVDEAAAADALGIVDRTAVVALADALVARDAKAALEAVERAHQAGFDLALLAEDLAHELRNLVVATIPGAPLDLPDHETAGVKKRAGAADAAQLARLADLLIAALPEVRKAPSPRLVLEIALLKAVHLAPGESVAALVARAEELARKLGEPARGRPAEGRISAPPPLQASRRAELAEPAATGDLDTDWRALCSTARARRAPLAAHLAVAKPLALAPRIVLGYPRGDVNAERIVDPANKAFLEELWGRPVEVNWLEGEAATRAPASLADQAARAARDRRAGDEKALRESIVDAVRVLDGDIDGVEVKD